MWRSSEYVLCEQDRQHGNRALFVVHFCYRLIPFGVGCWDCVESGCGIQRIFVYIVTIVQHFDVYLLQDLGLLSNDSNLFGVCAVLQLNRFKCWLVKTSGISDLSDICDQAFFLMWSNKLLDITLYFCLWAWGTWGVGIFHFQYYRYQYNTSCSFPRKLHVMRTFPFPHIIYKYILGLRKCTVIPTIVTASTWRKCRHLF